MFVLTEIVYYNASSWHARRYPWINILKCWMHLENCYWLPSTLLENQAGVNECYFCYYFVNLKLNLALLSNESNNLLKDVLAPNNAQNSILPCYKKKKFVMTELMFNLFIRSFHFYIYKFKEKTINNNLFIRPML